MPENSRQFALQALQRIHRGAFADIALDQVLQKSQLDQRDRRFVTELVYGSIRQQRTLDALIEQLAKKKKARHPVNLQLILRLGFYQLCFLTHIPPSAAVNTTVELAKSNGFRGLAGFVNGILRQYVRLNKQHIQDQKRNQQVDQVGIGLAETVDLSGAVDGVTGSDCSTAPFLPLQLPESNNERLGLLYSYPDWIIKIWLDQLDLDATIHLCKWFNRPPSIDLRVNSQRATTETVEAALKDVGLSCTRLYDLPNTLRLTGNPGLIQKLPGFQDGLWTIQDASAQLVSYLLDPQPNEIVIDACAAPGGKTTHIAELMGDLGKVWACDRNNSRLRKVAENSDRLRLKSISTLSRDCTLNFETFQKQQTSQMVNDSNQTTDLDWNNYADRVLVDAPCSGLGTLHRHADARWRQSEAIVHKLSNTQEKLLNQASKWVKPGGCMVYSTCTLHPSENEAIVGHFLEQHPNWKIDIPDNALLYPFLCSEGWLKVWPHQKDMDGFFMVRLSKK
ncbi:MAG: 16S rRNA (cytosine(967)-C(5))-methyltransferase [Cyanobacteria bacterium P01_F01_bin.150]